MTHQIQLTVNGEHRAIEVEPWQTLLDVLRDEFKLVRTKEGCGVGECGSCAVSMDRKTVNSCLVLALDADGKDIVTIEGLTRDSEEPEFHPLMEAFIDQGAMRASFASPGRKPRHEFFTFCHLCPGHCSVKAIVEEGKVVDMAPDHESGLPSELCPLKKGRFSIPEILSHRDRLLYPQKRIGARGEGKWERISWDEALDTIAGKFKALKEAHGPEAVAFGLGEPKGLEFAFAQRFASVFGTPNVVTPGWCCGVPTGQASAFTCGWNCVPDEDDLPKLLVLWGNNLVQTSGGMRRESLEAVLDGGGKLVVVDPRRIDMAGVADLWLRVRPGSDGALAMGALKVMIEEKLYDEAMVKNWTVGFDQLEAHVRAFTLEDVEKATWIPREQIEAFARLYTSVKPAVIHWGNGLDQFINSFQTGRAISIMRAISGNLNIPGGERFLIPAPFTRPGRFFLLSKFPRHPEKTLGDKFKVAQKSAFIPPHTLIRLILEEEPYPVKAAMFILTNPMVSYPSSTRTYEALMKLDFVVVSELFMTPTAALADILLPAAWGMEHEEVGYWPGWYESIRAYPKVVDSPGECWADTKIINELAKRLGFGEHFWEEDDDALDYMLEPSGIKYEEFKETRVLQAKKLN
ncbi:MAG: molybdopterin-dependent oxidoreductase, partial [Deltaproteobacteria bacterium]|nr:molybdopterin-dependent oxidoreductase [Deltaproteobacteria bacterium]